ncbi:hypothetical protein D3C72_109110 [compost metagenome]
MVIPASVAEEMAEEWAGGVALPEKTELRTVASIGANYNHLQIGDQALVYMVMLVPAPEKPFKLHNSGPEPRTGQVIVLGKDGQILGSTLFP